MTSERTNVKCISSDGEDDDPADECGRRRTGAPRRRGVFVTCVSVAVCLVLALCQSQSVEGLLTPLNMTLNDTMLKQKVCSSVDIRNNVQMFRALENCSVVEGNVEILLMDHAVEADYADIEFPHLREITGYLLLYRANGLRSLGKIFPNLAVIRGKTLFMNYALVSYEMMHLQEIGLHSLMDIMRGSVRFEKNPVLCYADTIDWDLIAKAGKGGHFIKGNRLQNECPMCDVKCPRPIPHGGIAIKDMELKHLCWNRDKCQKVCVGCESSCYANGTCCPENCLGSCDLNPGSCSVCKYIRFGGMCIKNCPHGTFEYLKRRCVSEAECYNMIVPKGDDSVQNTTWKPFNETSCIQHCPAGYEEKKERGRLRCVLCDGQCRKECKGANIDSIASAQKLRGCTHIKGALEIQITGGKNVVKELEENLNMIKEIDHYLKVVRSFPIISLEFLKSLRVIHGLKKESDRHALVVLDNQNIQELWDWEKRGEKLRIMSGRLFFHFNPKLCIYKIKKLNSIVGLSPPSDLEVAPTSNGDKVPCNITDLVVTVESTMAKGAVIKWDAFEHHDPRSLLGYVVYSIESPYNNLTLYDGRDACGSDGWLVDDVPPTDTAQILANLKPYTHYAFYVKTYMISTEKSGAQSKIHYFRTEPDVPSTPLALKVYSNSSTDLVIKWLPPLHPNGNVTHYEVTGIKDTNSHNFFAERNYCVQPITLLDKTPVRIDEEEKTTPSSCACEEKSVTLLQAEDEKMSSINFENKLQNTIYIPRSDIMRRRRSIEDSLPGANSTSGNADENVTFQRTVYNSNIVVISDLQHYSSYTIRVKACRELTPKEEKEKDKKDKDKKITENCSSTSIDTARTMVLDGADNIGRLQVEMSNHSLGMVKLMWDEPLQPNGIILSYHIEYQRMDIENSSPVPNCITRHQFNQEHNSYTLTKIGPGNYSVRVMATSLAGRGNYTQHVYFLIKEPSTSSTVEWLVGSLVGIFAVLVLCLAAYYVRRKYAPGIPNMKLIASVNPEYMSTVYVPDEWEVPRKKVELLRELGQGSFGMVYEGIGRDIVEGQPEIRCAIKTVGDNATDRERSEFLNEASVMKAFHTNHVVRLLGVVSQGQPVLVVMELMTHGDLKTYLRSHRPDTGGDPTVQPPTLKRILQMAIEIADGMAYLSAKKFVHRDLAARNCMVAEDLTVKIGDFGMTRDIYETDYYRKGTKGLLPVRWMAPESLKDGVFTSRSDVWSYGVVLWEMATLASQPYQGLSNDQVLRYVIDAGVMERPENCPDRLYELMRLCWQHKPLGRPHFLDLVTVLLADVGPDFARVSFYHSVEGCDSRAHLAETNPTLEDDPATPLRVTRDIEDFSLGDSEDEEAFEVTAHSSSHYPMYISNPPLLATSEPIIITSSNGSKLGNGSTVNSPTAANGWIANHSNGTDPSLKTTEC